MKNGMESLGKKTQTVFNNPSVTFCPLGSICLKTIPIVKKKRRNV